MAFILFCKIFIDFPMAFINLSSFHRFCYGFQCFSLFFHVSSIIGFSMCFIDFPCFFHPFLHEFHRFYRFGVFFIDSPFSIVLIMCSMLFIDFLDGVHRFLDVFYRFFHGFHQLCPGCSSMFLIGFVDFSMVFINLFDSFLLDSSLHTSKYILYIKDEFHLAHAYLQLFVCTPCIPK